MAQAYEGLANRDEAIANYRKIASLAGVDPAFQSEATKRADWLESKDGETFLTWFKENRQAAPAVAPPTGDRPAIPSQPTLDLQPLQGTQGTPETPVTPDAAPSGETPSQANPAPAPETPAPAQETPKE
jgi:hypothetical protein